MNVCHKHDCAYDGSCEACNLQDRLIEETNDLQATRFELIEREREVASLHRECEGLRQSLNHALARIYRLESV